MKNFSQKNSAEVVCALTLFTLILISSYWLSRLLRPVNVRIYTGNAESTASLLDANKIFYRGISMTGCATWEIAPSDYDSVKMHLIADARCRNYGMKIEFLHRLTFLDWEMVVSSHD